MNKRANTSKYISMLSDFGWKLYFGREEHKENLINLLNSLLEGEHVVADLTYSNVEEDGDQPYDRKVIFDLRCVGTGGEVFLVEMQLQNQDFFFDRAVSYTSRTISRLPKKGRAGNNYELPPVYFIAVLGFPIDLANREKYYYSAKIIDEFDQEVLYPKLSYKLLVLSNFNKPLAKLDTIIDQWMYLMKHLDELEGLPKYLDKRIFSRIFAIGELAKLTPEEQMSYISSLEQKRAYNATIAYAEKEGMEKGFEKGKLEERAKAEAEKLKSALELKKIGVAIENIAKALGLTVEQVEKLK
ncbi:MULTISPECIES: Rpn family recombination-promoting nuclease/putative transposase [Sphingobacterium]|uniref:Rpn family recombination-promoting nuclease/putative transposase n=1 Tax=Sphingobacterium TaxID=28453 RepID=UPI0013E47F13|nr:MULTISPECIES: Rpn family recombination-promoting nuclease/putative transposase [Sphingobacterium]QIH35271.1 Rpn family recombination-promoting nuclease/putative transposase [Sphingobacterium sp. DR205]